jgi:hypothetical protein
MIFSTRARHLLASMYPHLCRIDFGCNNYRLQLGRGRILPRGRAYAPRGNLPRAGLLRHLDPVKKHRGR